MPFYSSPECCKLVGSFPGLPNDSCLISISSRTNTEFSKTGNTVIMGARTGVISITAYASMSMHVGCVGRAGVTIPWITKYNCDLNKTHYIYAGGGSAYIAGDIDSPDTGKPMAELGNYPTNSYQIINASISSGPTTIYEYGYQTDGFGLQYLAEPWSFNTEVESSLKINTGIPSYGTLILQSFSLNCPTGDLCVASYEFAFDASAI